MVDINDAIQAVIGEREYQDARWKKPEHYHEIESYLVYMETYLDETKKLLSKNDLSHVKVDALASVRKIAALAVACMQEHGVVHRS